MPEQDNNTQTPAVPAAKAPAAQAPSGKKTKRLLGTPKQIAKSKRTRNTFILLSLLLVVAVGALSWFAYQYLLPIITGSSNEINTVVELPIGDDPNSGSVPLTISYEKAAIPNLVALFGLTTDQALYQLGTGWAIAKVTDIEPEAPVDPNNPEAVETQLLFQLVTLNYIPQVTSVDGSTFDEGDPNYQAVLTSLPTADLYLSLNADGRIAEVYYIADIELLGYPQSDFQTLLSDDGFLRAVLSAAGVSPRGFYYQAPDYESSLTYDNPMSANRRITKQSSIFSGRATNEGSPTAWAVTVTYEYMPPVFQPADAVKTHRRLYISLS